MRPWYLRPVDLARAARCQKLVLLGGWASKEARVHSAFAIRQGDDETASEKKRTRMNEKNEDDVDERERAFHGAIREYVVSRVFAWGFLVGVDLAEQSKGTAAK